jgi:inorganic pyrophosphatase
MSDEKGPDAKLLAVPAGDPRWAHITDLADVGPHLLEEIRHFFEIYKALEPGKGTEISHWDNAEVAWQEIRAATARYSST